MPRCKKPVTHNTTDTFDIPPDFTKGQEPIPRNNEDSDTILALAQLIQDPYGNTAINLAREVLKLISDRENDRICQLLIQDMQILNIKYRI